MIRNFFFILFTLPTMARAESPVLESYLREVEAKNPAIISAKKTYQAAEAGRATRWAPMDPSIELEKMYIKGPQERSFFLKLEISNPFKLSVRRKISATDAKYHKFSYLSVRNEILEAAEIAFYSYYISIMREKTYSEIASLLDFISQATLASISSGRIGTTDSLKMEIEYLKIKNLLDLSKKEKEKAGNLMNFFIGATGLPETPLVDENISQPDFYGDPENFPGEKNPEILMERTAAEKSALEAKEASYSNYPDLMAGYRKRFYGQMDGTYDLILGITLPIFFSKNSSRKAEAMAIKEAADSNYTYSFLSLSYSWKETLINFRFARDSALFYREVILPQTELIFKNEIRLYESGGGDIRNLVDSARAHLEAKLTYYGYLDLYYRSGARLKKMAGGIDEK